MMSKPILEIQHISKEFAINRNAGPYLSLRDSIANIFRTSLKTGKFRALDDVSFDVFEGDTIGIIGKNGAGKSTLLKILSRITPPTSGRIISRGRIASLLEVGTGFHAELTGRENVFMNGSILGMSRKEIARNFDAIVDFAGIEQFIDTPLKHYSSGMQLRLAFAVAAFLENEILIIDEVLAVGDAEFQKKCLGKMSDVSRSGRTILFVSHDLDSVLNICKRSILLEKGTIREIGDTQRVIEQYTRMHDHNFFRWEQDERPGDHKVKLNEVKLVDEQLQPLMQPRIDARIGVCIRYEILDPKCAPSPNLHIYSALGAYCFLQISGDNNMGKGVYETVIWIPENTLNNVQYSVGVSITTLSTVEVHLDIRDIITFDAFEDRSQRNHGYAGAIPGLVRPATSHQTFKLSD